MGKRRHHKSATISTAAASPNTLTTTSAISRDAILGYRLRVLLYDLLNVAKDPSAERRLNSTTDAQYISDPYFSIEQAAIIRAATVDVPVNHHFDPNYFEDSTNTTLHLQNKSFDESMTASLAGFLDKRKASGDARPCGPHHFAPLLASLFGIELEEVQHENFLSRMKRDRL